MHGKLLKSGNLKERKKNRNANVALLFHWKKTGILKGETRNHEKEVFGNNARRFLNTFARSSELAIYRFGMPSGRVALMSTWYDTS